MKAIKNIFAILMAVALLCSLGVTAFADETTPYTITINNAVAGQTYSAYKIFDATYVNGTDGDGNTKIDKISYTIEKNSEWFSDVLLYMGGGTDSAKPHTTTGVYTGKGITLTPTAVDSNLYVVEVTINTPAQDDDFDAAAFAAFLKTKLNGKTGITSAPAMDDPAAATINVSTKGVGYYYVDSNVGALGILDTVTVTMTVREKNTLPNIEKKVWEDDNTTHNGASGYGPTAVLDVIDTVKYQLTVEAGKGADENYIIVDTLPDGFTYTADSIAVSCTETIPTNWVKDIDYTVDYTGQVLTINLIASNGKLAGLNDTDPIVITYEASMTADKVIIGESGNTNTVTLTYKDVKRAEDTATVYTYEIGEGFTKVDGASKSTGEAGTETYTTKLEGVKFVLSRSVPAANEGDEPTIKYATVTDGYLTGWTNIKPTTGNIVTNVNGHITVKGLDAGEYTLTETETLPGYNLLADTITVIVDEDGNVNYKQGAETEKGTITVENNTGTELPDTGGIGTTIFTVVGAALMIGAAVLLITKKRMNGTSD